MHACMYVHARIHAGNKIAHVLRKEGLVQGQERASSSDAHNSSREIVWVATRKLQLFCENPGLQPAAGHASGEKRALRP